jgi:hypothetical protein
MGHYENGIAAKLHAMNHVERVDALLCPDGTVDYLVARV